MTVSIDSTVTDFYAKNPTDGYIDTYDTQHGPRLDAMIAHYGLSTMGGQRVADVGGGLGFLGKRLHPSNEYWVFDGSVIPQEKRLCKGSWLRTDIQRDPFSHSYVDLGGGVLSMDREWLIDLDLIKPTPQFDIAFCLETLEHLSDPYHCLTQIKTMVKPNGAVVLSIPTETVWHNTIYPGLLWPRQNWEQFLGQMALPIINSWIFEPKPGGGWPAYHYWCRNAGWEESRMMFPKEEAKFKGATPLQATNL